MRRLVLIFALLAACGAPASAAAQSPPAQTPPDERLAARQFAFAALKLKSDTRKALAGLDGKGTFGELEDERCERALASAGRSSRPLDPVLEVLIGGLVGVIFEPLGPSLGAFQARLDRVRTADPALRSGRAAWRKSIAVIARFKAPKDLCGDLLRWARQGFRASAAPDYGSFDDLPESDSLDPKLRRAAQRMRALGVPRAAARRFTGDTLLDEDLFDVEDIDVTEVRRQLRRR